MRPLPVLSVLACCLCGLSPSADAQALQPPGRSSRGTLGGGPPPDPNRVRHELTAQANLQIGWDENLAPPGVNPEIALTRPSGYTGFSDVALSYAFGNATKSIEVSGRGYANTFSVDLAPVYGADVSARAHTTLGRRNQLAVSQRSSYDPYFQLGVFSALPADDAGTPAGIDSNPFTALREARSLGINADASLRHHFTDRTQMTALYTYGSRTYEQGAAFDSRTQAGTLTYEAPLGRRASLHGSYRYSVGRYDQKDGLTRDIDDQNADLGLAYDRDLSRTRRVSLSAGGGALYVNGAAAGSVAAFDYWAPSGYAGARLDFRRSWSLSADYRRALSILQGIRPDPFVANTGTLSLGGYLGRGVEGVLNAGYANARAGRGQGGAGGRYTSYTGAAQLRFAVSHAWSVRLNYTYYEYQLNPIARESLGLPGQTNRNSASIGLSWSQPLFGRSRRQPQRPPAGRS